MENVVKQSTAPVTVVIMRKVKPGSREAFEQWASGMTPVVSRFDGYLGTTLVRPSDTAHEEYVIIVKFDGYEHLRAFMTSAERDAYLKGSEQLTSGEMTVQELQGFESFFTLPDQQASLAPPAKYKMAILTIGALYPTLLGVNTLMGSLFRGAPRALLILATLLVLVPLMTWFIMPWVTRLFSSWLYPRT